MVESSKPYKRIAMKIRLITLSLLVFALSASASENQDEIKSLTDEMKPYTSSGISDNFNTCKNIASSMVSKYGPKLNKEGKTPFQIMDSSLAICLSAVSKSETAKAKGEISEWKISALKDNNVDQNSGSIDSVLKEYLSDIIDKSAKFGTLLFLSTHDN